MTSRRGIKRAMRGAALASFLIVLGGTASLADPVTGCQPLLLADRSDSIREQLTVEPSNYALVMRHDEKAGSGHLTEAGMLHAQAAGEYLQGIPISGPVYFDSRNDKPRIAETANRAFPMHEKRAISAEFRSGKVPDLDRLMGLVRNRPASGPARAGEGTLPANAGSVVFVVDSNVMKQLDRKGAPPNGFACGEMAIVRVLENDQGGGAGRDYECVARLFPEEWADPASPLPPWACDARSDCTGRAQGVRPGRSCYTLKDSQSR